jgi:hypothetical protein
MNKFKSFLILFCLLVLILIKQNAYAAAPVTHAVLGLKWIDLHEQYTDEEKRGFILGTLFPDIRYLGVTSRAETHEKGVTLDTLLAKQSPFSKGKRLHAFVDIEREKLIAKWNIYDKLKDFPEKKYKTTFLKLLEDEILYPRRDWSDIKQYLAIIHPEERILNITDESIEKWHANQLMAFSAKPSDNLRMLAKMHKHFAGVPSEILLQWADLLPKYAENKEMIEYVDKLINEFDNIFQK